MLSFHITSSLCCFQFIVKYVATVQFTCDEYSVDFNDMMLFFSELIGELFQTMPAFSVLMFSHPCSEHSAIVQ